MNRKRHVGSTVLIWTIVCLAALCGCVKAPPEYGFLQDYASLHQDPEDQSLLWYEIPDADWEKYKKLMIDPVVVFFHPLAKNHQINPQALSDLAEYFRNALIEKVQDAYPVVDKPGAEVLRIRTAIIDLIPASPSAQNTLSTDASLPIDMGGAAMEAEFLDSTTRIPLGAIVDKKVALSDSPEDYEVGFTKWDRARNTCDAWAALLRASLDEVHGR